MLTLSPVVTLVDSAGMTIDEPQCNVPEFPPFMVTCWSPLPESIK